jgi:hypothetical protein
MAVSFDPFPFPVSQVLRIVPERSLNGAASVGVIGAGSSPFPHASKSRNVPPGAEEMFFPKASKLS